MTKWTTVKDTYIVGKKDEKKRKIMKKGSSVNMYNTYVQYIICM